MKRKINLSMVVLTFFAIITTMVFMTIAFNDMYMEALYVTVIDSEANVIEQNRMDVLRTDNTFYYAMCMENGNTLRVAREADSTFRYIKAIIPSMLLIAVVLFVISFVTAHLLTRKLISPIKELTENMDGIYRSDYYDEFEPFILKIREQHADLLKNSKMRQEFTANVTHELKTPLTSISGYAELIETGLASGDDTVRFAKGIHKSANRLLTLINDIIRLSELDNEEDEIVTESINLYQLASTCVEMLEPNAEKHNVSIFMQGENCTISGNRMMIEELLYNLCDNAIRYNNENGTVVVDVHPSEEQVVLTVEDTGIGIAQKHQERIFERFYRVDKSRSKSTGGTGLGLAIVKHIVEKHHAKLEVISEMGQGTTMKVIFECKKS